MTRLRKSLLVLLLLAVVGCREETLYTGLAEREVNEMAAALVKSGIPATRLKTTDGKYDLKINDSRYFSDAVTVLTERGLPRKEYDDFGKVFKGDSLVSTPTEIKARYIYAITQQLERTLSEISGVINARVQVVMPESDPITRQRLPSGASVVIIHDPALSPDALVPKIKQIVASSVDGLSYDGVSVTLFARSNRPAPDEAEGTLLPSQKDFAKKSNYILYMGYFIIVLFLSIWTYVSMKKTSLRKHKRLKRSRKLSLSAAPTSSKRLNVPRF